MKLILLIFAFIFFYPTIGNGYEQSDAFIVKVFNDRVKVLAPVKYDKNLNVIIENKTINRIMGKVDKDFDDFEQFVTIEPAKTKAIELKYQKGEKVYFTPLSPPFQRVELKLGNKSYEIPPKE